MTTVQSTAVSHVSTRALQPVISHTVAVSLVFSCYMFKLAVIDSSRDSRLQCAVCSCVTVSVKGAFTLNFSSAM